MKLALHLLRSLQSFASFSAVLPVELAVFHSAGLKALSAAQPSRTMMFGVDAGFSRFVSCGACAHT